MAIEARALIDRIKELEQALSMASAYLQRLPQVPATTEVARELNGVLHGHVVQHHRALVGQTFNAAGLPELHAEVVGGRIWLNTSLVGPDARRLARQLGSGSYAIPVAPLSDAAAWTRRELEVLEAEERGSR